LPGACGSVILPLPPDRAEFVSLARAGRESRESREFRSKFASSLAPGAIRNPIAASLARYRGPIERGRNDRAATAPAKRRITIS
jgi:hypothetical protein